VTSGRGAAAAAANFGGSNMQKQTNKLDILNQMEEIQ
jgi:hypothetical protein